MALKDQISSVNTLHKSLRQALTTGDDGQAARACFLELHSQLHTRQISPNTAWSYEDFLLDDLAEAAYRQVPAGQDHSIAWILWHLTRVEDITMNLLVAGRDQVFETGAWLAKTSSPIKHTGNGTGLDVAAALSAELNITALRAYRMAVGQATQSIVHSLSPGDFKRKVKPEHIQRILDEGAVIQAGMDVVEYWRRRDVAGLLLMPPTRHTIVHWNEVWRLKQLLT